MTKEWSVDLLIHANPTKISDIGSPEDTHKEQNTPGTNRQKNTEEVQNLSSTSVKTASMSLGGGDEVESEQRPSEVTLPRDEFDPLRKRKVSPLKPSFWKKSKASMTKMQTVLPFDKFHFIIAALHDASLEIEEKQRAK
jgi:hypothetical protein